MSNNDYSIRIMKASAEMGGCYIAEVKELPGCIADGDTRAEAMKNIEDAIDLWKQVQKDIGRPIPDPIIYTGERVASGKISVRTAKSLHAAYLDMAAKEGVSLNSLINLAMSKYVGFQEALNTDKQNEENVYNESPDISFARPRDWSTGELRAVYDGGL
jgi:antitoxin HicB